jgi:hypothetical protein
MLRDGGVVPSFVRMQMVDPHESHSERLTGDTSLHIGVVVAAYAPRDEGNYSKKVFEYDVMVMTSVGMEVPTGVLYKRCRLQTGFGGLADRYIWTPRVQVRNKDGSIKEPGSQVLLECPNGISRQAVIIGAVEPENAPEQSADFKNGPRLGWQFNGIDIVIDKDGALTLTRKGKTSSEGKYVDTEKAGASLVLDKDGQVIIKTGDDKQSITLNFDDGTMKLTADKGVRIEVAGGKLVTQTSEGVELGGGEKLILGDTYVGHEKTFIEALTQFMTQMAAVAATLQGAIMEPALIAAAPQLNAAIQAFTPKVIAWQTHLTTKDVLSKKNSTE